MSLQHSTHSLNTHHMYKHTKDLASNSRLLYNVCTSSQLLCTQRLHHPLASADLKVRESCRHRCRRRRHHHHHHDHPRQVCAAPAHRGDKEGCRGGHSGKAFDTPHHMSEAGATGHWEGQPTVNGHRVQ